MQELRVVAMLKAQRQELGNGNRNAKSKGNGESNDNDKANAGFFASLRMTGFCESNLSPI